LQFRLSEMHALRAHLVAISPQLPGKSKDTVDKDGVEFDILSDSGNNVARQFGLLFTIPEKYREAGKKFGLGLAAVQSGYNRT
jgi:peroxiredoxin